MKRKREPPSVFDFKNECFDPTTLHVLHGLCKRVRPSKTQPRVSIDTCLGVGGVACTVKARCLGQTFALKVPIGGHSVTIDHEKELWDTFPGLLQCPHLVRPVDVQGCGFGYCMELWDESLHSWLGRTPRSSIGAAHVRAITEGVCGGLAAMHSVGIIHRDVKPANIMVRHDPLRVAICDFGSWAFVDAAGPLQQGTTAGYRAPEIALNIPEQSFASDLFSVAVVLHEVITGTPVVPANTPEIAGIMGLCHTSKHEADRLLSNHRHCTAAKPLQRLADGHGLGRSSHWDRMGVFGWQDIIAVLKQATRMMPHHRLFGSATLLKRVLLNTLDAYEDTPRPARLTEQATQNRTAASKRRAAAWFQALIACPTPTKSGFMQQWFTKALPTKQAVRFQTAAQNYWEGGEWHTHFREACSMNREGLAWPRSVEQLFYWMKLPLAISKTPPYKTYPPCRPDQHNACFTCFMVSNNCPGDGWIPTAKLDTDWTTVDTGLTSDLPLTVYHLRSSH